MPLSARTKAPKIVTQEAWCEDDVNILHHFTAPPASSTAYTSPTQASIERLQGQGRKQPAAESEPLAVGTPPDQIMAVNEYKGLGTLEMMHEVLSSKGLDDFPLEAFGASGASRQANPRSHLLPHHKANIWVVRYVDYSSKYGLGFLLNTGSAGVYFNDSTKIVLSPDGIVFQYIVRRRKENGSSSSEYSLQTHLVSKYPAQLQKKVTLLRHFRNYLNDQQKEGDLSHVLLQKKSKKIVV
jgi:hypothetical protein